MISSLGVLFEKMYDLNKIKIYQIVFIKTNKMEEPRFSVMLNYIYVN